MLLLYAGIPYNYGGNGHDGGIPEIFSMPPIHYGSIPIKKVH